MMIAATVLFLSFTIIIVITSVWICNESTEVQKEQRFTGSKTDLVYLPQDIRDLIANSCKIPYIFLSNDDVEDYIEPSEESQCGFRKAPESILHFSMDGYLELLPEIKKNDFLRNTSCSYHELKNNFKKNESGTDVEDEIPESHELTIRRKTQIQYFDFAVVCKDKNNPMFVKPFLNFAHIYQDQNSSTSESVAILFLPGIHHKLFTKFFVRSKDFMLKNEFQLFKMFTKTNANPTSELTTLLGLEKNKLNIFKKATEGNFSTFFMGPQKVEALLGKEFTTSTFQKFRKKLLEGRKCMDDGKRIFEDDLKIFERFTVISKNSNVFSTFFIEDYGKQKNLLDEPLWFTLEKMKAENIFENTTLILATYSVSDSEETDEERNPLFAIRMSDQFRENYPEKVGFLGKNVNRLVSTLNMNSLISSLLTDNLSGLDDLSPLHQLFPSTSKCEDVGIPGKMCLCMKPHTKSTYNAKLNKEFLEKISKDFSEDIIQYSCVKNFTITKNPEFFDYFHLKKGELRVVELTASVIFIAKKNGTEATAEVRQTYKFEPFFAAYHAYDNARLMRDDGSNVAASTICD